MAEITISEGLNWMKVLKARHGELVGLRDVNSKTERHYFGANADKFVDKNPTYDAKKLDQMVTRLAREMRLLDNALKVTNATAKLVGYNQDDAVLGELE